VNESTRGVREDRTLVMFAKVPEAGKVKTRLALGTEDTQWSGLKDVWYRAEATALGHAAALQWTSDLYTAFLRDRIAAHRLGPYRFLVGSSVPDAAVTFTMLFGSPVDIVPLSGQSMGDLLRSAFQQLLPGKVLITASDYPVLPEAIIEEAFRALDESDVVLVPAADGAYNLIGMRRYHDIFDLPAWSSGRELVQTEARLAERGIPRAILRQHVLRDVDTVADLSAVMQSLDPQLAPRTAEYLHVWRDQLALAG